MSSVRDGKKGEDVASVHLESQGYSILARNWRGKAGFRSPEIDIVARKNNTIVFIEVKTDLAGSFGRPEFWINAKKQKRIIEGARAFIAEYGLGAVDYRFDAIIITKSPVGFSINHIENAFVSPE